MPGTEFVPDITILTIRNVSPKTTFWVVVSKIAKNKYKATIYTRGIKQAVGTIYPMRPGDFINAPSEGIITEIAPKIKGSVAVRTENFSTAAYIDDVTN